MTSKIFALSIVLFSLLLALTALQASSPSGSTQPPPVDVKGTWSGTFFSKYSNVASFTMTVVITPNSVGHLVGNTTLNAECLRGAQLKVTVTGSNVVLAGSD